MCIFIQVYGTFRATSVAREELPIDSGDDASQRNCGNGQHGQCGGTVPRDAFGCPGAIADHGEGDDPRQHPQRKGKPQIRVVNELASVKALGEMDQIGLGTDPPRKPKEVRECEVKSDLLPLMSAGFNDSLQQPQFPKTSGILTRCFTGRRA